MSRALLVLLHGGGVGPWMWRDQVAHFSRDFEVLTPTLPGHAPGDPSTFTSHADAAAGIAALLADRTATVVGFSLGGQTALQLAADYPHLVERLVVVSSVTRPYPPGRAMTFLGDLTIPLTRRKWFARAQARQLMLDDSYFDDYFSLSRSIAAPTLRNLFRANFAFEVPDSVVEHARPTLLVAGDREPVEVRHGLEQLHGRAPASELYVHPNTGHGFSLQHPTEFAKVLGDWFQRTALTP